MQKRNTVKEIVLNWDFQLSNIAISQVNLSKIISKANHAILQQNDAGGHKQIFYKSQPPKKLQVFLPQTNPQNQRKHSKNMDNLHGHNNINK